MKNYFGFTHASSFPLHEGQLFYWSIMTAIFIDIIAPKWIRALLKLAYFLSRDLSSTLGYSA